MTVTIIVNGKEIKPEEQKNYTIRNPVVNKIIREIREKQKENKP